LSWIWRGWLNKLIPDLAKLRFHKHPSVQDLQVVFPCAEPVRNLHMSSALVDGLVDAFVEGSRITTSTDSKKHGVEMHRVASDRSWPCRVIGWGDAFRFWGVGVGNDCLLLVEVLAVLIGMLERVMVSGEFGAHCRHPAKP